MYYDPLLSYPDVATASVASGIVAKEERSTLTQNHVGTVMKDLTPLASEWENIGVYLEIDDGTLSTIKADEQKALGRLREMLRAWLRRTEPPPTWTDMVEAVALINPSLGDSLRTKHCPKR